MLTKFLWAASMRRPIKSPNRQTIATKRKPIRRAPRNRNVPAKPKLGFFNRTLRLFVNGWTIGLLSLTILLTFLVATYFWFDFSDKINGLLAGEIFTQSAGIYAAPKMLENDEEISKEELIEYLGSAGYVPKGRKAASDRSRYEVQENEVLIQPGSGSVIDGKKPYRSIKVEFSEDGKSVDAITDIEAEEPLKHTQLEPMLLNTLAKEDGGRRKAVKYRDIPPNLIKAVTVTEDRAFFEHYGVNLRGIARAFWRRYEARESSSPLDNQGGSSITQQLVKNLLLSPEQSWERKAKEAYMSIILETRLSKEEIFTLYVNQIYLGQNNGNGIYGVGEAANIYFGKDVSALTLSESAFIAGIIRSPNRYNPFKNPERVEERRNQILSSMAEVKAITPKQEKQAKATPLELNREVKSTDQEGMEYFSQYAVEEIPKLLTDPETVQHSRVYTTIDPDLQRVANEVVSKRLARLEKLFKKSKREGLNASLVAIRPETGEIVAMIGGKDFRQNQFNRATSAMRQPGSVFKPFVYAAAINTANTTSTRVITPATIFTDEKKTFNFNNDTYSPNNYGDFFSGKDITLRDALVKSKNTITVDLALELNIGRVMNLASKAGIPKVKRAFPSMALGTSELTPLQMASAYTMFANLGESVSPIAVKRITDGKGKTIVTPETTKRRVVSQEVAYVVDDMMKDVINVGTAAEVKAWGFKNVAGKRGYAGKTGTSRDGWFVGFTPHLVCAVYVGFDDGSNLNMKGSDSAMPIWAEFMREALRQNPEWEGDWTMPPTIRLAEIDTRNGNLIRELSSSEVLSVNSKDKTKVEKEVEPEIQPGDITTIEQAYIANVPAEFRRVEMFLSGTVPVQLTKPEEEIPDLPKENIPVPTATPFTTWENAEQQATQRQRGAPPKIKSVSMMICPVLNMRAGPNCPNPTTRSYKKGSEPKRVCTFHYSD